MNITLDLPLQYRAAKLESDLDEQQRLVRFSFSSDAPVLRALGDGSDEMIYEILDHSPESIDQERLNRRAVPFLDNHDPYQILGKVIEHGFRNGKGYAVAKLRNSPEGDQALRDIKDGIRTETSFGYFVEKMHQDGEYQGKRQFRVTRWKPYEISLVTLPADFNVGIGRSENAGQTEPCNIEVSEQTRVISEEINMAETVISTTGTGTAIPPAGVAYTNSPVTIGPRSDVDVTREMDRIRETEITRMREIRTVGDKFGVSEEADRYIRDGRPVAEFNRWVLDTQFKRQDQIVTIDPNLGQKPEQRRRYNLCKAILEKADGKLSGYELEMHQEMQRQVGRQAEGFLVPDFVWTSNGFRRDLSVTGGAGLGGETIQQITEPSLVEYLRNVLVTARAGATVMTGLRDNIALPRQISTATSQWVTEAQALTTTNLTFDQVLLAPNRIGATTQYTRQLLIQSVLDINNIVRDDLFETIGHQIDYVAFNGTGTGAQPFGILHTVADTVWPSAYSKTSPSVVFSGSGYNTWSDVVQFETNVAANNVFMESPTCCYVTSPKVKGLWKTLAKSDPRATTLYYPSFLWEPNDTVNGYRSIASNQLSTSQVVFGKFDQLILAYWGGTDIIVDPYTMAKSGEIVITMNLFVDVALRHSPSFCYSTAKPFGVP